MEDELPDDVFSGIAQKLDFSFTELDELLETWNEVDCCVKGSSRYFRTTQCRKINLVKCVIRI